MDKKTKLMAICAAGAAAILIGAGLARCAIAPSDPDPVVPVEEQSRQSEQAGESLAGYAGTTWESEDGTCTLALSDSTIVESGEAGVQVMYYEVLSEEPDGSGISIPRNTEAQYAQGKKIALSEAQPGDILYRMGHVGIYIGGDRYIHAPHRGEVVKIASGISSFTCALSYR